MTKPKPNKTNKCQRCGHKWISRIAFPNVCPKCHSIYWRKKKKPNKYGRKQELCPLCGKPSPKNKVHKECADYEQCRADKQ